MACVKRSEICTTDYSCRDRHGPSTCTNCECVCDYGYYRKMEISGFQCVICLGDDDCYGNLVCREDECKAEETSGSWWKMFLIFFAASTGLSGLIGLARYFYSGGNRHNRNVVTPQPRLQVNNVTTANQPAVIYNIHSSEVGDHHRNQTVVARDSDLSGVSNAPPSYDSMFPQGCPYDPNAPASPPPPYPGS